MAKQLIVSVNGREKKIAIIEDDKVSEFYIERGEQHQGIVGNIYKGRVMRVLPGMQSAFVDIGLERDAFLYVSDFFDEEEEFERIVIDKSKKGTPDAEHAAAEEVALNRVEREQQIEATQERAEPLQELEIAVPEDVSESPDSGRRRGRRGRRRGRWEKSDETTPQAQPPVPRFEVPDTPFVAPDPSIERIVDEEETAANGEMFKDARLQERLFDQIHAVEFNMEDEFSNTEVGSILSAGFSGESFQRIDDGDTEGEPIREERRPREAHVSSFVDDVDDAPRSVSFQRISDDEEEVAEPLVAEKQPGKRARKPAAKKGTPKAATKTSATKKKASSKKSSKKRAASEEAQSEGADAVTEYPDSDARVVEGQSRGEFATRRGGRRRRRTGKNRPQGRRQQSLRMVALPMGRTTTSSRCSLPNRRKRSWLLLHHRPRASTPRSAWARSARASRTVAARATATGDYGPVGRGPGDTGPNRKRTDRQKRRAHHFAHRAARTVSGVHADGRARRRLEEDRVRHGTSPPAQVDSNASRGRGHTVRWIHSPHRRCRDQ